MDKIYGAYLSPFVRKVVLTFELKGIPFEMISAVPGMFPQGYKNIHPLMKIPTLQNEEVTLPDSSVICQYLDDKYPDKKVIPAERVLKAKTLWLEEYADTKVIEVTGANLFFERFMKPLLGKAPDEEKITRNLETEMPKVLEYLEERCGDYPGIYMVGNSITVADFAIMGMFLNARYVGFEVDAAHYPKFRKYLEDMFALPLIAARIKAEERFLKPRAK